MIQPYQAATEEIRRQSQNPERLVKTAGAIGTSLVGGTALASKVLPFLNQFVPGDIMQKGLSKINPGIGKFINTAASMGYSLDEIRNFMKNKFSQSNQTQQQSQSSNPLQDFETNYPDIAQALSSYINQGQPPQAAAAILKTSGPFGQKISNLEKTIGKNFVDYVLELYGNPQNQSAPTQQAQPQTQNPQMQQPQSPQQMQQPQQAQQPQQPGQGQQALMAILQKISQTRGQP